MEKAFLVVTLKLAATTLEVLDVKPKSMYIKKSTKEIRTKRQQKSQVLLLNHPSRSSIVKQAENTDYFEGPGIHVCRSLL